MKIIGSFEGSTESKTAYFIGNHCVVIELEDGIEDFDRIDLNVFGKYALVDYLQGVILKDDVYDPKSIKDVVVEKCFDFADIDKARESGRFEEKTIETPFFLRSNYIKKDPK